MKEITYIVYYAHQLCILHKKTRKMKVIADGYFKHGGKNKDNDSIFFIVTTMVQSTSGTVFYSNILR